MFAQFPTNVAHVTDGLSNTVAFSERPIGNGATPMSGVPPADPRLIILEVPGGNDPTPADCDAMNRTWVGTRGGQWINGHFGHTLYNHYYTPNVGKWDCGNGSHNKALSSARSYHSGGINVLLSDGSVRFVSNGINLSTWRALATRAGDEVIGDY